MSKYQHSFKRYEIKYLVTAAQRDKLEQALAGRVIPDPYGESTICNLYFDTPDHRLIRRSMEKPIYKEKLRLRSYGIAHPGDTVFLELKKKYKKVVYKRRISLTEQEAVAYMSNQSQCMETQIGEEIDYFRRFYGQLAPAMYLCYDRVALYANDDPNLRITFDTNVRWREENLSLTAPPGGNRLLCRDQSLMEIKTPGALPLWLAHLLSQNSIYKTSFSKYGNAYLSTLQKIKMRGEHCA